MITIYENNELIIIRNGNSGDEFCIDYNSSMQRISDAIEFALNVDGGEYKFLNMEDYDD